MSDYFVFDGVDSRVYGVELFEIDTESASAQEYTTQTVPGKSGDFLLRMNRFPNRTHSYHGLIYQNYANNVTGFKGMLLSKNGYKRLEDSFHPNEYYMACFHDVLDIEKSRDGAAGKFEINFDRKPQRYLKSGDTVQTLTANGTIVNPTAFTAKPLLRVYGTGVISIGDQSILINSADGYTDIDCEIMEAYKGTASCNGRIQVSGYDFPVLRPGSNGIRLNNGITRVDITPRWWQL